MRVIDEPQWPQGGFGMRAMDDRNWDINQYSEPVASVPTAGWSRGSIVKFSTPTIHPPMLGYYAYDPTDPGTWHQSQS